MCEPGGLTRLKGGPAAAGSRTVPASYVAADLLDTSVTADIDMNSFDTGNTQRDVHVRSG